MAKIETVAKLRKLFRYRSINDANKIQRELDSIHNGYLYCAPFSSLNDPMEGAFTSNRIDELDKTFIQVIRDSKANIGVCSFTEHFNFDLFWSHYASSGNGICIGYDMKALQVGLPENSYISRILYVDQVPSIAIREEDDPQTAAMKLLSIKKSVWSYEREWRVLAPKVGKVKISAAHAENAITDIYLGINVNQRQFERDFNKIMDRKFNLWKCTVNDYEFKWDFCPR